MTPAVAATRTGILQLHVTRRCNLTCSHCYSSSGPSERGGLAFDSLPAVFATAAQEGYGVLSLSGGEPLMDRDLFRQIDAARDAGLRVNLVTNGTLVTHRSAARLASGINLAAVSLDGPPAAHNALRGSPTAFDRAVRGIGLLRDAGVRFAVIHTVRADALAHLRWLAGFARELGATALQLHPLELTGRAAERRRGRLSEADLATRLALLAGLIAPDHPGLDIHVDVLPLSGLPRAPDADPTQPLAALIDTLVVKPDGILSPWTFGMPRAFSLGDLSKESLGEAADRYRHGGLSRTLVHAQELRRRLQSGHPWPYVNWFEHLAADAVSA